MEQITVNCTGLEGKEQLHAALAQALAFPDWYGHNLDALYDCLTDLDGPVHLHLLGYQQLGDWKAGFTSVLNDAENDCMHLIVSYE